MTPAMRKFVLTAHIISSVGWLGAVAAFLALSIAGLTSSDSQRVRAAYLAMDMTGWLVIVPLSFATLVTGLINSLGSAWGLFRHYWVLFKLLIAAVATALLLLHMEPTSYVQRLRQTRRCRARIFARCGYNLSQMREPLWWYCLLLQSCPYTSRVA